MLYILLWIQVIGQVWAEELCCWSAETKCGDRSGNALPPPQEVYVDSLLRWTPAPDHRNVTYTAQYRSFDSQWQDIPDCVRTELTSCDVTDTKARAEHGCVELRVRAEKRGQASVPVEACSEKGDSCSPVFSLIPRPDSLTVSLSNNHSLAQKYAEHAAHRVCYGKEGARKPLKEFGDFHLSKAIEDVEEGVRYCVKVQFTNYGKPVGPPSCTQCELIPISEATRHAKVVAGIVALLIALVLIPVIAYILIYKMETIKELLRPQYEMPRCLADYLPEGHQPISSSSPVEVCDRLVISEDEGT